MRIQKTTLIIENPFFFPLFAKGYKRRGNKNYLKKKSFPCSNHMRKIPVVIAFSSILKDKY
jgi:hypothetical protein